MLYVVSEGTTISILSPVSGGASLVVSSQHPRAGGTSKTFRTLKVRLKPNADQEQFLNAHIGATKFAYNCVKLA